MDLAMTLHPDLTEPTLWEKVATTRWGSYVTEVERRTILRAHLLAGQPSEALEIGCEGGRWSKMLADDGWKMTCTDVDRGTLAVCQARLPEAKCILVQPEETTLPCASESQSLLLCVEVAPVIQSDWFPGEAARVLRPGGILVGVCWNRNSLRGGYVNLKARLKNEPDEFYRRSYPSFRRALARNQLEVVHERGFCWGPFWRESNSSLVPGFVIAERIFRLDRVPGLSPWVGFIAQKRAI